MRQSIQLVLFSALSLLFVNHLNAQLPVPFWTEDFTNGLPAGWGNEDASGQDVLWTWCPNPVLANNDSGCSSVFEDALNGQTPFNSTTAKTGSVLVDSDEPGDLPTNHISKLTTTPINCSGKNQVYITFQTHIGVYTENAEDNAILRVSTNGTTWTDYTVFPGLTTTERWSDNPERPIIDISATAANQPNVWIQWQWTGNWEYMWNLDDIEVYGENPTPRNDAAISAFYYPVSSYSTPVSQIATDTFFFEVNLNNNGLNPQTNLLLTAYVKDEVGAILHTESIAIPSLDPGVTDSGFVFPSVYVPNLSAGLYKIGYTLTSDSTDQRPADNARESDFVVSNNVFAKEDRPEQGIRPGLGGDWAVGNYYKMSGGNFEQYKATQAEFAFSTDTTELAIGDVEANIYLFKIHDDVAEDFSDFDNTSLPSSSMDWIGNSGYEAPDSLESDELQVVDLTDFNSGTPGVLLETGARYLLAIGYEGANNKVYHAFNDNVYYYFPSTFIFNSDWNVNGFGGDANALLRLYIGLLSTTDEQALPENTLGIFPNPVRESLQLEVKFAEPTDATITIADINGRVINFEDRYGLTNDLLHYSLPALASGTYLARIATAKGTLTKKFVVQQ